MEKGKDLEITILGRKIAGINILWAFCILAFLAWLLYQIIVLLISKPSNVGEYGDMFGSLNALFAALAFVGLIFAILLQREELKLQREELKLAREELTQQTKVISAQLEAMQESIDLQREKEYRESEPIITCKTGQASNIQKNLILVNYGGRITELEVSNIDPQSDRKVSINPKDVLDKYSEGKLTIKGKRAPDEFKFKLSYTDKLGNRKSIKYLVPKDLFEIRQLNQ